MGKLYRGQKKLGDLLKDVITPAADQHTIALFKIMLNWPHIVGQELASYTAPQYIRFPPGQKRDGVLTIVLANPGFSLDVQASEPIILQKISAFFGYQQVSRIKIEISKIRWSVPAPTPRTPHITTSHAEKGNINDTLDAINDEELRSALSEFADAWFVVPSKNLGSD